MFLKTFVCQNIKKNIIIFVNSHMYSCLYIEKKYEKYFMRCVSYMGFASSNNFVFKIFSKNFRQYLRLENPFIKTKILRQNN